MRPTRSSRIAAATVAALILAACSSGDATEDPTPTATASTSQSESPTPDETTESASPSEDGSEAMTVEEAQQIVDATTAVYNDATIQLLQQQRIGTQWYEQMRSIYVDEMVDAYEKVWTGAASRNFEDYNTEDPTGVSDRVLEVVTSRPDCLVVNIERDFSGVVNPDSDDVRGVEPDYYLAFRPVAPGSERNGAGTGWLRTWDVRPRDGTLDTDLCERELDGEGQ